MLLSAVGIAELRKLAGLWDEEQPFPRLLATIDAYEQHVQRLEAERDRLEDERDDLAHELYLDWIVEKQIEHSDRLLKELERKNLKAEGETCEER